MQRYQQSPYHHTLLTLYTPCYIRIARKIVRGQEPIPNEYQAFVRSPLAGWLEDRLGLRREAEGGRLLRGRPRPIVGERGIARELGRLTGMEESACERVIRDWLLAGYNCEEHPESHTKPFAFRLHQFISPGDSVYASLEEPGERHLSLSGQQFVPGSNKARVLLPLAFCRECGAEYSFLLFPLFFLHNFFQSSIYSSYFAFF